MWAAWSARCASGRSKRRSRRCRAWSTRRSTSPPSGPTSSTTPRSWRSARWPGRSRPPGHQYLGLEGEVSEEAERAAVEADLAEKRRRILVGFGVGIPLMLSMWFPFGIPMELLSWIQLVVATPAFVYVAAPIFRAAWLGLRNRTLNMDVMYAMGIGVAYVASVMGTLGIVLTTEFMFYETALILAAFLTLGR